MKIIAIVIFTLIGGCIGGYIGPCRDEDEVCRQAIFNGYELIAGRYVKFYAKDENWFDARASCQAEGADLITILSNETNDWILSQNMDVWIGATDQENEGRWIWPSGDEIANDFWQDGKPNNFNNNENCVMVVNNGNNAIVDCNRLCNYACDVNPKKMNGGPANDSVQGTGQGSLPRCMPTQEAKKQIFQEAFTKLGQERAEEINAAIQKCKEENKEDRRGMEACFEVIKEIEKIVEEAGITWECPPKTERGRGTGGGDDDEFMAKWEGTWGQGNETRMGILKESSKRENLPRA